MYNPRIEVEIKKQMREVMMGRNTLRISLKKKEEVEEAIEF